MRWYLLVLLAACDGADDDCDPGRFLDLTQSDVTRADLVDSNNYNYAPVPTAVGGWQRFTPGVFDGCGTPLDDERVTVSGGEPSLASVQLVDGAVELHALGAGTTEVRVVSETGLASTTKLAMRPIASIVLAARELGDPDAFLRGTSLATVILRDEHGQPLVDRRLAVAGASHGARWNELDLSGLAPGDHDVVITAGVSSWPLTVRIANGIDRIEAQGAILARTDLFTDVCFYAWLGDQRVGGVPWRIDFDRDNGSQKNRSNCVTVWQGPYQPASTLVTAHALGLSASTLVTFTR